MNKFKVITCILIIVYCLLSCSSNIENNSNNQNKSQPTDFDFKLDGITWDINEEAFVKLVKPDWSSIKNNEKGSYSEYLKNTRIGGLPDEIRYYFKNGSLDHIWYKLEPAFKCSNPNDYVTWYNKYQDYFINKFGKNYSNINAWYDIQYKNDKNQLGQAIAEGHVSIRTIWSFKNNVYAYQIMSTDLKNNVDHWLFIEQIKDKKLIDEIYNR
ncbi:MAG: hypothetical protein JW737_04310 [Acidobacteria bacterium]|nr:hypothetical protein [Acidobacteriota bacterium]